MLTLILPSFGKVDSVRKTVDSVEGLCDEVIITSTCPFLEDKNEFKKLANKVVELPWNYSFLNGLGKTYQHSALEAKNNWLLLLGAGETVAEEYNKILNVLEKSSPKRMYCCNHRNDINVWKRIWNTKEGGTFWSGIIHEEITNGDMGDVIFRMQDTKKLPEEDSVKEECYKIIKGILYNSLYDRLYKDHSLLGAANIGWLEFVRRNIGSISGYLEDMSDLYVCVLDGDFENFGRIVKERVKMGIQSPNLREMYI